MVPGGGRGGGEEDEKEEEEEEGDDVGLVVEDGEVMRWLGGG